MPLPAKKSQCNNARIRCGTFCMICMGVFLLRRLRALRDCDSKESWWCPKSSSRPTTRVIKSHLQIQSSPSRSELFQVANLLVFLEKKDILLTLRVFGTKLGKSPRMGFTTLLAGWPVLGVAAALYIAWVFGTWLRYPRAPGPWAAQFTNLWYGYRMARGHFEKDNMELHQKYGMSLDLWCCFVECQTVVEHGNECSQSPSRLFCR